MMRMFFSVPFVRSLLLVNVINAKTLMKTLSFDSCKRDNWRVTNVVLEPVGDKIKIIADIGFEEKPTSKLHQINVTLTGCDANFNCNNHTNLAVGNLDCREEKLTELDKEACDVAKILAEWEQETGDLTWKQKQGKIHKTSASTMIRNKSIRKLLRRN